MKDKKIEMIFLLLLCVLLAGMLPMATLAAEGTFTVTMNEPDDSIVAAGDIIEISVVIGHTAGMSNYNSFDMGFSYDPAVLELKSTKLSGMSITAENGTVRVLRYGNDLTVGEEAFTLSFKAVKSGETTIRAVAAKVGIRETAQEKDAADAVILNNVTLKITADAYEIKVADTSGGTVTVNPKEAQAGTRVEIKVTPKSGYEMKTLTVTDANGKM